MPFGLARKHKKSLEQIEKYKFIEMNEIYKFPIGTSWFSFILLNFWWRTIFAMIFLSVCSFVRFGIWLCTFIIIYNLTIMVMLIGSICWFWLVMFFKYMKSIVDWSWMIFVVHIGMAMNKIGFRISFFNDFAEFFDLCFSCDGRQSSWAANFVFI